jgi:hypothetical protein
VPAVVEATRIAARKAVRPETPARLRLWVAVTVVTAVALPAALSLLMIRVQEQVRIIGDEAAPQAATAADLYFALSDLDAQVARMVLTAGDDDLAGTQIDALGSYQARSRQVDADLQRSLTTSSSAADRAAVLALLNDLSTYRERVWQTLTAGAGAAGYYTQATNVLHLDLLPAAQALRDAGEARLAEAYDRKRATQVWAVTLAVVLGVALLVLLLGLQVWMARRFRRVLNPALLAATLLTVALVIPAVAVLVAQERGLAAARTESLSPFLALSQARAISYDAAADTSRYLISDNLSYYDEDFRRKATWLTSAGGLPSAAGGPDVSPYDSEQVVRRWTTYQQDHQKIVALAAGGRKDEAVGALTGIRRGDAAFDFSYFDAAVGEIAASRRASFDDAMSHAETLLTGWAWIPLVAMGLVLVLIPSAVRRRFAEYR